MLRVRALQLQRSSQPDFWERCARLSGLVAGTAGGRRQRPVHPRPLPYFIQLFLLRLKRLRAPVSTRRFFVFVRRSDGGRIGAQLLYYYKCCESQVCWCLNRGLRGFVDWRDGPALLSPFTLTLTLSHQGRGDMPPPRSSGYPPARA